jgi:hypothetical protein
MFLLPQSNAPNKSWLFLFTIISQHIFPNQLIYIVLICDCWFSDKFISQVKPANLSYICVNFLPITLQLACIGAQSYIRINYQKIMFGGIKTQEHWNGLMNKNMLICHGKKCSKLKRQKMNCKLCPNST